MPFKPVTNCTWLWTNVKVVNYSITLKCQKSLTKNGQSFKQLKSF